MQVRSQGTTVRCNDGDFVSAARQVVLQDTTTDQVVAMKLPLTIELLYANMTPVLALPTARVHGSRNYVSQVTTASVLEVTEAARFAINDKGVAHTQACAKQCECHPQNVVLCMRNLVPGVCFILAVTKNHGGVPFIIRISARTGDRSAIAAAVSRAFTVVYVVLVFGHTDRLGQTVFLPVHRSYRLSVIKDVPKIWFKDEGGRDKAMQVELRLLDKNGSVCTNRLVWNCSA